MSDYLHSHGRFTYGLFSDAIIAAAAHSGGGARLMEPSFYERMAVSRSSAARMLEYRRRFLAEFFASDALADLAGSSARDARRVGAASLLDAGEGGVSGGAELLLCAADILGGAKNVAPEWSYDGPSGEYARVSFARRLVAKACANGSNSEGGVHYRGTPLTSPVRESVAAERLERLLPEDSDAYWFLLLSCANAEARGFVAGLHGCAGARWTSLMETVADVARLRAGWLGSGNTSEMLTNSEDDGSGVLDARRLRREVDAAGGESEFDRLLKRYLKMGAPVKNACTLMLAALGIKPKNMDERLHEKRNQLYLKAYALLPLTDDPHAEVGLIERYRYIERYAEESDQFGKQRQKTERAAARAALTNLALNAGYADAKAMERSVMAMTHPTPVSKGSGDRDEALPANATDEGADGVLVERWDYTDDKNTDYAALLVLEYAGPKLYYERYDSENGKPQKGAADSLDPKEPRRTKRLKSPPALLKGKDNPQNVELKDAQKRARRELGEQRRLLEDTMVSGGRITQEAWERQTRLPAFRLLVGALLFVGDDGRIGMPVQCEGWADGGSLRLRASCGTEFTPSFPLRVAHPYHIVGAGEALSGGDALTVWQRHVLGERLLQPFKQAYRELYVLTPAEQTTRDHSRRFADQTVDTRVAYRLMESRGWEFDDTTMPTRKVSSVLESATGEGFGEGEHEEYVAGWRFPDAHGAFFGAYDTATTGELSFFKPSAGDAHGALGSHTHDGRIPLEDVPPLVFSEIMRDLDLVVGVAQSDDEGAGERGGPRGSSRGGMSRESYERRAQLLGALISTLKLDGVTVEGHFAKVKGSRADYRVHLGSAAIHVEPGNYLCVVPAEKANAARAAKDVFLPFSTTTNADRKAREVVSKVLLLVNDAEITDGTILAQLKWYEAGRAR